MLTGAGPDVHQIVGGPDGAFSGIEPGFRPHGLPSLGKAGIGETFLDQISEEMADKVTVVKCNVDDCEDVAMRYRIMNIPTLLFFKNGEMVDRSVGAVPKAALVEKINSLL